MACQENLSGFDETRQWICARGEPSAPESSRQVRSIFSKCGPGTTVLALESPKVLITNAG